MANPLPKELVPPNDAERLRDLKAYNLLYTAAEDRFDNLTQIMAQVFEVPLVFMSLVDENTVFYKSQVGDFGCDRVDRQDSLCSISILKAEPTVFVDTWQEASLATNPLIKGQGAIRFYAGAPLTTTKGNRIGSICVVDTIPRSFSAEQQTLLERFARLVMHEMDVHLAATELAQAREAQKKLLKLVENSADVMSILELDGTHSYINPAGRQLLGFERAQAVSSTPVSALHTARDHAFVREQVRPAVMKTGRWSGEMNVRHLKTGEVFPVYSQIVRIDDSDTGLPLALGAVMRDLRPEREVQQALSQSEQLSRTMIEQSPMAIGLLKGRDMVVDVGNDRLFEVLGKDASITGMRLVDVLPEIEGQGFMDLLEGVFDTGQPYFGYSVPAKLVRGNKQEEVYFDFAYTPLRDTASVTIGVMVLATDVTQQVLARQKLEIAEESLRGAIDLANLATWGIDPVTNVITYGDRMKEWLGIDATDRGFAHGPAYVPEQDRARVGLAIQRAMQPGNGGVYDEEHLIENARTGQRRIIHSQARTYFNAQGQPYNLLGTAQDVTEQRQLQLALEQQVQQRTRELKASNDELAESNGLLLRSNENLEKFAYVASHDLQEPLRKIQQFGDLLKDRYAGQLGDGVDYLERMQGAAQRMSMLIRDLLAFSRIATQRDKSESVPLADIVEEVVNDLDVRIQEAGATVRIDSLPTVLGDASQLTMLFQNLLSNALKFHGPDSVPSVRISSTTVAAGDLPSSVEPTTVVPFYSCTSVSDNGIGFDEKYLDRIFQVFQRLHGKNDFVGTGIGLAICEKVAANHGGAITAQSQTGQGSTFSVYLPA